MKCPNCGFESPEGTEECPRCQIVLRKWEDQRVRKALSEHHAVREEAKETSSLTLRLFVMFLVCAGLYWLVRPSDKQEVPAAAPEPAAAADVSVPQAQAERELSVAGPAESRWRFEGSVRDLLRGEAILGAKLYFSDPVTGRTFSAETDYDGHYSLELKPLEQGGYRVKITHPDFGGRWWDVKVAELSRKQRFQQAARPEKEQPLFTGKPGAAVTADFAVFPAGLSAEEKNEMCSAAPKHPDCAK